MHVSPDENCIFLFLGFAVAVLILGVRKGQVDFREARRGISSFQPNDWPAIGQDSRKSIKGPKD